MNTKLMAVLLAGVVVVAGISAYVMLNDDNGNDEGGEGNDINTLIIGTTKAYPTLTDGNIYEVKRMIVQETLVNIDAEGNYIGLLAESWSVDELKWTFNLRTDVVWSDGEEFDATDVAYSFEIGKARRAAVYTMIDSWEISAPHKIEVTLNAPVANFFFTLTNMPVMPEHIWKNIDWQTAETYTNYVGLEGRIGTGPYVLSGLDTTSNELKFVANEKFRDGEPNIKNLILKSYANETAMLMALSAGQIDTVYNYGTTGVSNSFIDAIKGVSSLELGIVPGYTGLPSAIYFNYRHEYSANEDFRLAVKYAIDYANLIQTFAPNSGMAAKEGVVPTGTLGMVETDVLQKNLTLAKEHMGKFFAAQSPGATFDSASNVHIDVAIPAADALSLRIMDVLKPWLAEIKVTVDTVHTDSSKVICVQTGSAFTMYFATPAAAAGVDGFFTHYAMGPLGLVFDQDTRVINPLDENDYSEEQWQVYQDFIGIRNDLRNSSPDDKADVMKAIQEFYAEHALILPMYWDNFVQPYNVKYDGFVVHPYWGILCYETFFGLKYA